MRPSPPRSSSPLRHRPRADPRPRNSGQAGAARGFPLQRAQGPRRRRQRARQPRRRQPARRRTSHSTALRPLPRHAHLADLASSQGGTRVDLLVDRPAKSASRRARTVGHGRRPLRPRGHGRLGGRPQQRPPGHLQPLDGRDYCYRVDPVRPTVSFRPEVLALTSAFVLQLRQGGRPPRRPPSSRASASTRPSTTRESRSCPLDTRAVCRRASRAAQRRGRALGPVGRPGRFVAATCGINEQAEALEYPHRACPARSLADGDADGLVEPDASSAASERRPRRQRLGRRCHGVVPEEAGSAERRAVAYPARIQAGQS